MPGHTTAVLCRLALAAGLVGGVLLVAAAGGCWLLVILAVLAVRLSRPRWPGSDTYGAAAFATRSQVRTAGLTEPGVGLHLGALVAADTLPKAQVLRDVFTAPLSRSAEVVADLRAAFGGPADPLRVWAKIGGHASICACTRSGKGAAILTPTLLASPTPFLVFDPKGELYTLVKSAREAMGRRVFCFDPYRVVTADGGCSYNPFDWVSADDPFVPDIAKDFAAALVTRTGQEREPFFPNASEQVIQAVVSAILWGALPADRHLVSVADLIADPKLLANTLASLQQSDAYGGVLRTLGHQVAQMEGREKFAVLSSVAQYLGWLNSQPVRDAVRTSTVDPLWLKGYPADIFIVLPHEKLKSASGFTRFVLTGFLRRIAQGPPSESNPVTVILDEAAALGHLEILETAITLFAGWGVKLCFVWQALAQVGESFPGDKAKTFQANMSLQVFGKTNSLDQAQHVSAALGETTVLTTSVQDGGSYSCSGGDPHHITTQHGTSWGVTRSEAGRRLLQPQEILALPPEIMIVFSDRAPPMLVRQVRYYTPEFWRGTGAAGAVGRLVRRVALAGCIVFAVLVLLIGLLDRPEPRQVSPADPTTPGRANGRPAGGSTARPNGRPPHGQEDRGRPRQGNVPPGPR